MVCDGLFSCKYRNVYYSFDYADRFKEKINDTLNINRLAAACLWLFDLEIVMEDFDEKPIDLTKPEYRSSDSLIKAISKLETTTKELEKVKKENLLLKIANAELRDQLDTINTRLEKAFYDDKMSFWDALVDIRKTIKKDSTND